MNMAPNTGDLEETTGQFKKQQKRTTTTSFFAAN